MVEKSVEQLIKENEEMARTIADMGNQNAGDPMAMKYLNEVTQIKKLARVDTDKIQVKEITDHKNISLWTKDGKRIGPLHQTNALAALQRFFAMGILLSTRQPAPSEIEQYKATPEYKKRHEAFLKLREQREKTKKKGEMEKILKQMAETYGLTMDKLNSIVNIKDLKPLSAGREASAQQATA